MGEQFPSIPTMIVVDSLLVVVGVICTWSVIRFWRDIRNTPAVYGIILVLLGLWLAIGLYAMDLFAMTILPRWLGSMASMQFMNKLHTTYSWYLNTTSLIMIAAGLVLIAMHVSRQLRSLIQLNRDSEIREQRLEQAATLSRLGFYMRNVESGELEYCTPQHAETHGMSIEQFSEQHGIRHHDLQLINPHDREHVRENYAALLRGETVSHEYRVATKQGERRVREMAKPVFDEHGKVLCELGASMDITEQHSLEQKFYQAQKLESIGSLTGGIAHDFNNLLAVILGNLEFLGENLRDEKYQATINDSIEATMSGRKLCRDLLSFARKATLEPTPINVNQQVQKMNEMIRRTLSERISIDTSLMAGIWPIESDQTSIESALLNLVINARDAMPEGGKLTIETANLRVTQEYADERGESLEPGRYVMIAVSDTGRGIEPDLLDTVFEPFATTKPFHMGSGLGLSMVHGFMNQTGGVVRIYSELGVGTTVKMFFPTTAAPGVVAEVIVDTMPSNPAPDAPNGKSLGRVLLVEDQPSVRKVLAAGLRRSGYEVVTAEDADAAIVVFDSDYQFNAVVTDIVMPSELQGPELVKALRERNPALPAVFLSGYPHEATAHGNGLLPNDIRLMKPVSRAELAIALKKVLKASSARH